MKPPGSSKTKIRRISVFGLKKNYKDVEFSLRIDYNNTDIFFREDKLEMRFSELASICSIQNRCEK